MKVDNKILQGYENTALVHYDDIKLDFPNTIAYKDLSNREISGVLKSNKLVDGKLLQTYSLSESHQLTIAATRMGKTTQCVIPQIISFASQKIKRSLIISDPKGELYKNLSIFLKEKGYDVLLFNFRDYLHSEYWNPLTDIYKKYQRVLNIENEVEVEETKNGPRNKFQGVIYNKQKELDIAIEQIKNLLLAEVDTDLDKMAYNLIPPDDANDQYWNDASRQLFKALGWAMLEDSVPNSNNNLITEESFSFNTMFTIMDSLTEDESYDNDNYFSNRGEESKAYNYVRGIIKNASSTRQCIVSSFYAKMGAFRTTAMRLITSCSSFDMSRLVSNRPVAIFITYPDESKVYYQIISMFVQNAYNYLIDYANNQPKGKLNIPFYFILDEFGNFPKIPDFDVVISACGGRNIWFNIVLQSYAQLNNIYGKNIAEIIRDNLNIHMFLGSNNPATLKEFSDECGLTTRISPTSALNGTKAEIEHYNIETIPLIPKSILAKLKIGECIVTEANSGYVLFSKMERYYLCDEFNNLPLSSDKDYCCKINPLEKKYAYNIKKKKRSRKKFDFKF